MHRSGWERLLPLAAGTWPLTPQVSARGNRPSPQQRLAADASQNARPSTQAEVTPDGRQADITDGHGCRFVRDITVVVTRGQAFRQAANQCAPRRLWAIPRQRRHDDVDWLDVPVLLL